MNDLETFPWLKMQVLQSGVFIVFEFAREVELTLKICMYPIVVCIKSNRVLLTETWKSPHPVYSKVFKTILELPP